MSFLDKYLSESCGDGEYCDFVLSLECNAGGARYGVCRPRPKGCPQRPCAYVHGCDGKWYCNACDATKNGVDVACVTTTTDADPRPLYCGASALMAESPTSMRVTLGRAGAIQGDANAIVYNVYVSSRSGGQSFGAPSLTSSPGAASVLVQNLVAGSTYYVVVRAKDPSGREDGNTRELSVKLPRR
ncbi:MAG TPA: fibronectin type III domain-containing protein [Polyangiaceae bacterium]|jgi:hypothetical protein|nr:fibronectin type III domain-containing protein [Polyangiaceae bacterium]